MSGCLLSISSGHPRGTQLYFSKTEQPFLCSSSLNLVILISVPGLSILPLPSSFPHISHSTHSEILLVPDLKYTLNVTSFLLYCPHCDLIILTPHLEPCCSSPIPRPCLHLLDPTCLHHTLRVKTQHGFCVNIISI